MANGDENTTKKLHIVMFPWLAFGHIIPFLELSKFLALKGHKISFISTPRNIDRLPKIPSEFSNSITFVKIPLPKIDGLPKDAEATMDITSEEMTYLKKAMDGMENEVTNFLENNCPDWIIQDFAQYWLAPISTRLVGGFFGSTKMDPFETKATYRLHEARWMVESSQKNVSGVSDMYRNGVTIEGADAIIIRHCHEFEGQWLKLLEDLHHMPVLPTGLMPPIVESSSHEKNESWISIKEWLDEKPKGSVVYVALGSEVTVGQNEINELARGLELSGSPFFWVLRKSSGLGSIDPIVLPDGFEERTKDRGIVWKSWAPQLKILSHESVGGFLTHCGWSSIIEGLMFGHSLIMLPFLVDQGLNARIIEDKGVGIEVPRNEEDGSYTSNSVANSVKLVMVKNDGKLIREKAKELSSIFSNKELHDKYIENLINFLEDYKKSQ
ncbi:LOW QUALITY PROTEIN: putative UDP-rhamnose:rhamnosyltransferase 1 [Solanum lycopersicum]|uniref:LOW QUALITY PROTEIN: putative UDP-rhamnose:rhamnosyltransferase 1 n=1 Tax=Solanum lycopersicum TaxID=4081 RepID=UPI00374A891A